MVSNLLLVLFSILITVWNHVSLVWHRNLAWGKTALHPSPDSYKGSFQSPPSLWCFAQNRSSLIWYKIYLHQFFKSLNYFLHTQIQAIQKSPEKHAIVTPNDCALVVYESSQQSGGRTTEFLKCLICGEQWMSKYGSHFRVYPPLLFISSSPYPLFAPTIIMKPVNLWDVILNRGTVRHVGKRKKERGRRSNSVRKLVWIDSTPVMSKCIIK